MAKKAWKSKTEITNITVAVLSALSLILGKNILPIPPQYQVLALGIINAILRFFTKEEISL